MRKDEKMMKHAYLLEGISKCQITCVTSNFNTNFCYIFHEYFVMLSNPPNTPFSKKTSFRLLPPNNGKTIWTISLARQDFCLSLTIFTFKQGNHVDLVYCDVTIISCWESPIYFFIINDELLWLAYHPKKEKKCYQTFNNPKLSLKIVKHFFGENMMSSYWKSS